MGLPDHLTCLLRNLYTGQETTVRTGHGTTDWFQIEKGVRQNNRMAKTRDLFNKTGDTKGTLQEKMGTIKERSGKDLTEAEAIKKSGKNIQKNYTIMS